MIPILANAGVPMIFVTLPAMLYLIVPVIVIEFLAGRRLLTEETTKTKWIGLAVANIASTFLGWPLAWVVLVVLQMTTGGGGAHGLDSPIGIILSVTQQAPWLIPYEDELYWMIPIAMGVLLVPFFFVSVFSERLILIYMWKQSDKSVVRHFSWNAHLWSYGFLLLVVFVYATYSFTTK